MNETPQLLRWYMAAETWVKGLAFPRMGWWMWLSIMLIGGVAFVAAHMLKVLLWKAVLITLAAFLGDKVARAMERGNKRPHELLERAQELHALGLFEQSTVLSTRADAIYMRRALIISAAMIAAALGS